MRVCCGGCAAAATKCRNQAQPGHHGMIHTLLSIYSGWFDQPVGLESTCVGGVFCRKEGKGREGKRKAEGRGGGRDPMSFFAHPETRGIPPVAFGSPSPPPAVAREACCCRILQEGGRGCAGARERKGKGGTKGGGRRKRGRRFCIPPPVTRETGVQFPVAAGN